MRRIRDWLDRGCRPARSARPARRAASGRAARAHRRRPARPTARAELVGARAARRSRPLAALAFIVVYALDVAHRRSCSASRSGSRSRSLAAALSSSRSALVVTEELDEHVPASPSTPAEQEAVAQLVEESGDALHAQAAARGRRRRRRRRARRRARSRPPLRSARCSTPTRSARRRGGAAAGSSTSDGRAARRATTIEQRALLHRLPRGRRPRAARRAARPRAARPARAPPARGREGWAPDGIVAYSKICTHAGCAISLYRTPTFAPTEPKPALVCPCHYSTFDPARRRQRALRPGRPAAAAAAAGDRRRAAHLRAAGNFSGPVGPSWWGVRNRRPTP